MTLSVTCKLIELSLHEYVTTVEFPKILSQYLAFTSKKIINLGELQEISKLSIRFSASADDRNTFSFVCVSSACGTCTPESVLR